MSSEMLTRCPHCKAAFKVSQDQLGIAKGKVRCGACMNVFDAVAYAINDADNPAPKTQEPKFSAPQNEDLIQDNPDQDQLTSGYQPNQGLGDEFSTSFKELDEAPGGVGHHFGQAIDDTIHNAPDDESWATNMLEEEAAADKASARQEHDDTDPSSIYASDNSDFLVGDPDAASAATSTSSQDSYAFDDFLNQQNSRSKKQDKSESISFYYDTDDDRSDRHWSISALFILFNSALIISLIILAGWFHYEKLAKYPVMSSIYSKACEIAGCTLPELKDLDKIKSRNLVVRSHPTQRDALIIDTIIINEAGFEQNFPSMAIYFADINNQTIAQRLIMPEQYLSKEALSWGKMPVDQAIHVSLEVVDPGKAAVNYALKFFPTETNNPDFEQGTND